MNFIVLHFYSTIKTLSIPFVLLWLALFKFSYIRGYLQRLGIGRHAAVDATIWVHASSLGEVNGISLLVEKLLQRYPDSQLLFTAFTPAGLKQIQTRFRDRVIAEYFPWDSLHYTNSFLRRFRPQVLIVMETEIWPSVYASCRQQNVPVTLVNARLSEAAFRRYLVWRRVLRSVFASIRYIHARSARDSERFSALGISDDRIGITGNIKYDIVPPQTQIDDAIEMKKIVARPVWLAASTHEGEDAQVLDAFRMLRKSESSALLIIAPRHVDRGHVIEQQAISNGFNVARRTAISAPDENVDVYIVDTMGELTLFYSVADIAFVGGSLIPIGGHNPIEPAYLRCPIVSGVYVDNFRDEYQALENSGAVFFVVNREELASMVARRWCEPEVFERASCSAYQVAQENRGALAKTLEGVCAVIDATPASH